MKKYFLWRSHYIVIVIACLLLSCTKKQLTEPDPSAQDVTLTPPPAGKGVQLVINPFTVAPGTEVQRNYFLTLPSDSDIYISKIQFAYNTGSHHCNVFKADSLTKQEGTFDETFLSIDYSKWDMFAASQQSDFVWQLPTGVAIKLKARQQIAIQTHYVNGGSQLTPNARGKVLINFWTIPKSEVTNTAGLIFSSNNRIDLPPHDSLRVQKLVVIPWDRIPAKSINILAMTGHFHSRGKDFWAEHRENNHTEIYRNISWDEPKIKIFSGNGYILPANHRLDFFTKYYNSGNDTIRMGPHVINQEHSNLFLFYYPGTIDGKAIYDIDGGW
ncbi:MAG: hypothetical protein Q8L88_14245 [Bacteroidota bacterium]|nr:hypothetical protein [Bacteroidota bacterium]